MKIRYKMYKNQNVILLLCLFVFGLTSCVKQSGYEDCVEGIITKDYDKNIHFSSNNVKAIFIVDSVNYIGITGYIPNKYIQHDSTHVCMTYQYISQVAFGTPVCKIKCIKEIE
ncbi:MAG: hypothetical protein PHC83_01825 [Bacteroidales bacterium]|nr:hypothetical protein [Bacteroidales bacterium]MDD4208983.1 hypothetical protein [Bacteroidales bacterium]